MLRFEWDERKNQANFAKHKVTFQQAASIWASDLLTHVDDRFEYDEIRSIALGVIPGTLTVLYVVYTEPYPEEAETIRIISARPATRKERNEFYATMGKFPEP